MSEEKTVKPEIELKEMEQFEQNSKPYLPPLSKDHKQEQVNSEEISSQTRNEANNFELPFNNLKSINNTCFNNITNNSIEIEFGKEEYAYLVKLEQSKEQSRQQHELQLELLRLKQQVEENKSNQEFQWELEEFRKNYDAQIKRYEKIVDEKIAKQQLDFQHLKLEQEEKLQRKIAEYDRQTKLMAAQKEIEATLSKPELEKSLDYWPLTIFTRQILQYLWEKNIKNIPFYILFSPPKIEYDRFGCQEKNFPDLGNRLEQGIREFLEKNYPDHDQERPTKFLGGAWDSKRSRAESSIEHLFSKLQSLPMLVLESEIDGNYINLRMGYWKGIQKEGKQYEPIKQTIFSQVDYAEIIYKSVRARTEEWEKERENILKQGETDTSLKLKRPTSEKNLEVLYKEREGYSEVEKEYTINKDDINALNDYLNICHCLIIGYMVDGFYLRHYNIPPLLPKLLSQLIQPPFSKQDLPNKLIEILIQGYRDIYQELIKETPAWEPEFYLQLAKTLLGLHEAITWIKEEIKLSLSAFLKQRNKQVPDELSEILKTVELSVTERDEHYLQTLNSCLKDIGYNELLDVTEALYKQGIRMKEKDNHQKAVVLFTQVINRDSTNKSAYLQRADSYIKLKEYQSVVDECFQDNITKFNLKDLSNKDRQLRLFIAKRTPLPNEEPFKTLTLNDDQEIRQAVASNVNTSVEILVELCQDTNTNWVVCFEAFKNVLLEKAVKERNCAPLIRLSSKLSSKFLNIFQNKQKKDD